jgi:hypothetical protein
MLAGGFALSGGVSTSIPKLRNSFQGDVRMTLAQLHSTIVAVCIMTIVTFCATISEVYSAPPVDLIVSGTPKVSKPGPEILAIARQTRFFDEGKVIHKLENGQTFEYTPAWSDDADQLTKGVTDGVLTHRLVVSGTPDPGGFAPGTYFTWVEFVGDRWQSVTISTAGAVRCVLAGVEVRQEIRLGEEEHSRVPEMALHSHGTLSIAAARYGWGVFSGQWQPAGPPPACKRTLYCQPIVVT